MPALPGVDTKNNYFFDQVEFEEDFFISAAPVPAFPTRFISETKSMTVVFNSSDLSPLFSPPKTH